MIDLRIFNQFMMISVTAKPSPLTQPSTSLYGKQIHMSGLYTAHRQFLITL